MASDFRKQCSCPRGARCRSRGAIGDAALPLDGKYLRPKPQRQRRLCGVRGVGAFVLPCRKVRARVHHHDRVHGVRKPHVGRVSGIRCCCWCLLLLLLLLLLFLLLLFLFFLFLLLGVVLLLPRGRPPCWACISLLSKAFVLVNFAPNFVLPLAAGIVLLAPALTCPCLSVWQSNSRGQPCSLRSRALDVVDVRRAASARMGALGRRFR